MKKISFITVLFFIASIGFCQVPADSLPGTYVGQYWYANPYPGPWVITQDTEYISSVDTTSCILFGYGPIDYTLGGYYCSDYYSCNTCIYKLKFYSGDSIHAIYDSIIGPPDYIPKSRRFYGKRISGETNVVNNYLMNDFFKIYPNPCAGIFNVEDEENNNQLEMMLTITDLQGRIVKNENLKSNKLTSMDVRDLNDGIYFIGILSQKGVYYKKLIIKK